MFAQESFDQPIDEQVVNSETDFDTSIISTTPRQSGKKRKSVAAVNEERAQEAYEILKASVAKDDLATYGDHVANEIRKLRTRTQLFVKHEINNLLYRAALQDLDAEDAINQLHHDPMSQEIETSVSSQTTQAETTQDAEDSPMIQDDGRLYEVVAVYPDCAALQDLNIEDVINRLNGQGNEASVPFQTTQAEPPQKFEDHQDGRFFEVVAVSDPKYKETGTDDIGLFTQAT